MPCHLPGGAKAARTTSSARRIWRKCRIDVRRKSGGFFSEGPRAGRGGAARCRAGEQHGGGIRARVASGCRKRYTSRPETAERARWGEGEGQRAAEGEARTAARRGHGEATWRVGSRVSSRHCQSRAICVTPHIPKIATPIWWVLRARGLPKAIHCSGSKAYGFGAAGRGGSPAFKHATLLLKSVGINKEVAWPIQSKSVGCDPHFWFF